MEKQIKEVVYGILHGWLEELPNSDNTEQKATITAWAIYGAAVQWSQKSKPELVNDFVQQVLPIITAGLEVQSV